MRMHILEMFDHFRISEININTNNKETLKFWTEIFGDRPYSVNHNDEIKNVIISGGGEHPLKDYDIPIETHLELFDLIKHYKSQNSGMLINGVYIGVDGILMP